MASTSTQEFAAEDIETVSMDAIRAAIARQGGVVRTIKKEGGDWSEALAELQALRKLLEEVAEAQGSSVGQALKIDRELLDAVLVRRMFVVPSFEIYGGTRGFTTLVHLGAGSSRTLSIPGENTLCSRKACWRLSAPTSCPTMYSRRRGTSTGLQTSW